jgi:hypothetical protein
MFWNCYLCRRIGHVHTASHFFAYLRNSTVQEKCMYNTYSAVLYKLLRKKKEFYFLGVPLRYQTVFTGDSYENS